MSVLFSHSCWVEGTTLVSCKVCMPLWNSDWSKHWTQSYQHTATKNKHTEHEYELRDGSKATERVTLALFLCSASDLTYVWLIFSATVSVTMNYIHIHIVTTPQLSCLLSDFALFLHGLCSHLCSTVISWPAELAATTAWFYYTIYSKYHDTKAVTQLL